MIETKLRRRIVVIINYRSRNFVIIMLAVSVFMVVLDEHQTD